MAQESILKSPLLWIAGAAGLYFLARSGAAGSDVASVVTSAEGTIVETAQDISIANLGIIPDAAKTYADIIHRVGAEEGVDPLLLTAIGWRESRWGTANALDQFGPAGTGDYSVRTGHWLNESGVQVIESFPLPPRWRISSSQSLPVAIPGDGRGWGRGLMQIDYLASLGIDWADPETNIREGALIWKQKRKYIANKLPGLIDHDLDVAATAAYNHGEGGTVANIRNGGMENVDLNTTGNNYSADVITNYVTWSNAARGAA